MCKLAIGSAQFGLKYGISNIRGKLNCEEVKHILDFASKNGVSFVDTAQSYGDAEVTLGRLNLSKFDVVTKLSSPFDIAKSLNDLQVDSLYGVLFHSADDLLLQPELWEVFEQYKKMGVVDRIGVSVYDASQVDEILAKHDIDIIQLPLSIIDQRLISSGYLKLLKEKNIEIHVRSIFLQGLIFVDIDKLNPYFAPYKKELRCFHEFLTRNSLTPLEAALDFVLRLDEVSAIVCGVNSFHQFKEICYNYNVLQQSNSGVDYCSYMGSEDVGLVNPVNWRLNK